MKTKHKLISGVMAVAMLSTCLPAGAMAAETAGENDIVDIVLSDQEITVDGQEAGTEGAVYLSHDIIYYEDRDTYDSGNAYGEGTAEDKHSAEEAAAHTVVNITEPGTYRISGTLSQGQIAVDLGSDAKTDPDAVVTLILDNADVTCTVAPAVIFYNVYECDTDFVAYDEGEVETYDASGVQDTSEAGANVILADGSVNNINGAYVARIYKDNGKNKKLYKFDGAFYSKMSMNVDGEEAGTGVLNINAENEGLDSELHLTINGGKINIQSQDDGINTNEDNVSVTTINGGSLHIVAGLGSEGDGIDSNGYLTINGGVVISIANPASDSGLDSDMGSVVNGGYVVATGSTMDWAESDSDQVTMNLQFATAQGADEAIIVTDQEGSVVFAYDPDQDETTGSYNRSYQGAVISCPEFAVGETYQVFVGGDVAGTDVDGLYDASTVTGFTGAIRQIYTGTDVGMGGMGGPGGDMGGFQPDGDFQPGEMGEMPDGFDGQAPEDWDGQIPDGFDGQLPDGFPGTLPGTDSDGQQPGEMGEAPALPDGQQPGDMGEMGEAPALPDGQQPGDMGEMPDGGFGGGFGDQNTGDLSASSSLFYMTDKVNAFSGVQDDPNYQEDETPSENPDKTETPDVPAETPDETETPDVPAETPSITFPDVTESDWFYAPVMACVKAGIINGMDDGTFSPENGVTRAQAAKMIVKACGIEVDERAVAPFSDTAGHWAEAYIAAAQANGLMTGMGDGTFSPETTLTRGQLAALIVKVKGLTSTEGSKSFTDVDESAWYAADVAKASAAGYVEGDADTGLYRPEDTVKRSEFAKVVAVSLSTLS